MTLADNDFNQMHIQGGTAGTRPLRPQFFRFDIHLFRNIGMLGVGTPSYEVAPPPPPPPPVYFFKIFPRLPHFEIPVSAM